MPKIENWSRKQSKEGRSKVSGSTISTVRYWEHDEKNQRVFIQKDSSRSGRAKYQVEVPGTFYQHRNLGRARNRATSWMRDYPNGR